MSGKEFANSSFSGDANLQAYYKLESGALTTDSSGNSKTLTNTNTVGEITGKFNGGAGVTTNTNKQLTTSDTLGIGNTTARSISLWVKRTGSMTTNGVIAGHFTASTGYANYIQASDANSIWFVSYGTGAGTTGTCDLTLDTWHHIVLVDNGATIYGYKDGVLQGSTARQAGTSSGWVAGFHMFARANDAYCANIDLDDVVVFNRALTSTEIRQLALGLNSTDWSSPLAIASDHTKVSGTSNLTNFPVLIADSNLTSDVYAGLQQVLPLSGTSLYTDPNLVGYWKFDETSGTTLTDEKSVNNLTATNASIVGNSGRFSAGLTPDGTNYASKASPTSVLQPSSTQDFSVSFWIKGTTGTGTDYTFIANQHTNTIDAGWWLVLNRSTGSFSVFWGFATSAGQNRGEGTTISGVLDNSWHNVVISWSGLKSGETLKTYKDGVIKDNRTFTGGSSVGYHSTMSFFVSKSTSCQVDDISCFNKMLTQTEIDEINGNGAIDGADLRITTDAAGTTEIPFEIVSLDTVAETSEIWAKVPTLLYASNTPLFIWYGNASALPYSASDTYGSQNVWTDYSDVWHLQETSGTRYDSTSNNNLAEVNSVLSGAGKIGNGADFERNNSEYLNISDASQTGLDIASDFSFSGWINVEAFNGGTYITFIGKDGAGNRGYEVAFTAGSMLVVINAVTKSVSHSISTGALTHVSWIYDASAGTCEYLVNGSSIGTSSGLPTSISNVGANFRIGASDYGNYFDGIIDDVRVRKSVLSSDWIATEYNNQNSPSTFWTPVSSAFVSRVMIF